MDCISLIGVECRARVGVPDSERKKPQTIFLDIHLELPLEKAGRSDDVRDTIDYWAVEKKARKIAETGEFHLVERLAWKVAEAVLALDGRLESVRVQVHKHPKVMPKTREVVVDVTHRRS